MINRKLLTINRSDPVPPPIELSLWGWGSNTYFQLGDGTTVAKSSPVQVGSLTNWAEMAGNHYTSAAIRTDGTLWTCGENHPDGRLGLGDVTWRSSPVQVGSLTDWSKLSCGFHYMSVIKTDGTLWTWGESDGGTLGLGDIVRRSSPCQVGALTDWDKVTSNNTFVLAIQSE